MACRIVSPWLKVCLLLSLLGQAAVRAGRRSRHGTPMHKVLMTQRGYIQFLRWEMPVPEIEEFTFCLWIESTNLTLTNSIFSYSKHETERLISSWISAGGQKIHLEIGGRQIFAVAAHIRENRWYHVCQSWDNREGRYAVWLDGRREHEGYASETAGHVIPSNGDLVVGQEYTDFDKGLDEGLEGSVLGFNFLLVSAFDREPPLFKRSPRLFFPEDPGRDNGNQLDWFNPKPRTLGEYLVRTTYERCELGRASPFIDARLLLVSWTRTPVKVFGGAVVKNVGGPCGHFAAS